jgi:tripartite-type tricarboxylate transporter receptor subunit TctC
MALTRRRLAGLAGLSAAGAGLALVGLPLRAQNLPRLQQARLLTGFPPGDVMDSIARVFAEKIKDVYATTVIVDNKPGAGARLAPAAMKTLPADGSNVLFTPAPMVVLYPHVFKALAYDPLKDLVPVARVSISCFVLAVGPAVPASVKTVAQYLDWCRANPALALYGTSGAGGGLHLTGAELSRVSGVPLTMVPYKGGGPVAIDLIAGQVPAAVSSLGTLAEHARAGKVRLLAVSSAQRWPGLPDVPTFAESGYPQLTRLDWFGVFMPAGTPPERVRALHAAVAAAAQTPDVVAALGKLAQQVAPSPSPEDFARQVRADFDDWGRVAKALKFEPMD